MNHAHSTSSGLLPDARPVTGVWGVMAEFADPAAVYHAAEKCRDAGFKKWDVYSPVPIHGIDEAMGLKPSKVAWIMGTAAACGLGFAVLLQGWTSAGPTIGASGLGQFSGYPMVIGGKPFFAWEQFLPVMFELSVLFSAFGAILGMLAINGLPRWHHPVMAKERFLRVGDDRFIIAIEAKDPMFDASRTREFLASIGGTHIDMVEDRA